MKINEFFRLRLPFGKQLIRLHHTNALFFLFLTVTGLFLFSTVFRSSFPEMRVWVKESHIWVGFFSCLPLLFYVPKARKHLHALRKKKPNRMNVYIVAAILITLIGSGLVLTFHRQFPPVVNTWSLFLHDAATWLGVPYVIFHSVTRSKWFKRLTAKAPQKKEIGAPVVIDEKQPLYKRRTVLKMIGSTAIVLAFLPAVIKLVNPSFSLNGSTKPDGNRLSPLPTPDAKSAPPIGGGRRGDFRYYTVTEIPQITNDNFQFRIDGLVDRKASYRWEEFVALSRSVQVSDFHCVTGWSVYDVTWEGIPLKTFLQQAGVQSKANYVKFYSADGVYTDTLSIEQALMSDMLVAVLIDGELITQQNGGPVRLITPKMYAYKSVKWLNRIELIEKEHIGYWEQRGYDKDAWVKSL